MSIYGTQLYGTSLYGGSVAETTDSTEVVVVGNDTPFYGTMRFGQPLGTDVSPVFDESTRPAPDAQKGLYGTLLWGRGIFGGVSGPVAPPPLPPPVPVDPGKPRRPKKVVAQGSQYGVGAWKITFPEGS